MRKDYCKHGHTPLFYMLMGLIVFGSLQLYGVSSERNGLRKLLEGRSCACLNGETGIFVYNESLNNGTAKTITTQSMRSCNSIGGKYTDYGEGNDCIIFDPSDAQVLSLKNYCGLINGKIRYSITDGVLIIIVCDGREV